MRAIDVASTPRQYHYALIVAVIITLKMAPASLHQFSKLRHFENVAKINGAFFLASADGHGMAACLSAQSPVFIGHFGPKATLRAADGRGRGHR